MQVSSMQFLAVSSQSRTHSSRKRPRSGVKPTVQHVCKGALVASLLRCGAASHAGGGQGGNYGPPGPPQRQGQPGESVAVGVTRLFGCRFVAAIHRCNVRAVVIHTSRAGVIPPPTQRNNYACLCLVSCTFSAHKITTALSLSRIVNSTALTQQS